MLYKSHHFLDSCNKLVTSLIDLNLVTCSHAHTKAKMTQGVISGNIGMMLVFICFHAQPWRQVMIVTSCMPWMSRHDVVSSYRYFTAKCMRICTGVFLATAGKSVLLGFSRSVQATSPFCSRVCWHAQDELCVHWARVQSRYTTTSQLHSYDPAFIACRVCQPAVPVNHQARKRRIQWQAWCNVCRVMRGVAFCINQDFLCRWDWAMA